MALKRVSKEHEKCVHFLVLESITIKTAKCLQILMEEFHRKAIRQNLPFLIQNIDIISLTDYLREDSMLTDNMCEQIESERTTLDKISKFLNIIQRRGPHAFNRLIIGLEKTEQKFIAEKLLQSIRHTPVEASSGEFKSG